MQNNCYCERIATRVPVFIHKMIILGLIIQRTLDPHPLANVTPYLDTCSLTKYVYWVMRSFLPSVLTWHPTTEY